MARPTTKGSSILGPKTVGAFFVGIGVGLALVAPILPAAVDGPLESLIRGSGSVIVVGVVALAVLMVLMAVFYQLYLQ